MRGIIVMFDMPALSDKRIQKILQKNGKRVSVEYALKKI